VESAMNKGLTKIVLYTVLVSN